MIARVQGGKWHEIVRTTRTPLPKARWWHRRAFSDTFIAACGEALTAPAIAVCALPNEPDCCAHCRRKLGLLPPVTRKREQPELGVAS